MSNTNRTLNELVVSLFNNIMDVETKVLIKCLQNISQFLEQ